MPTKAGAKPTEIEVTRDSTFARVYVDNVAALYLGPELELSMMISSPTVTTVKPTDDQGSSDIAVEPVYVELCRARMTARTATNASFNIIFALLQSDKLDVKTLRSNIEGMIAHVGKTTENARGVK